MNIEVLSDLHGYMPPTLGGDLLIIAGDLTANDSKTQNEGFRRWLCYQDFEKKIVIAGNHDNFLENNPDWFDECEDSIVYLCDSGYEYKGLRIWGSPWTPSFIGVNPKCTAFMKTDDELSEYWAMIPENLDILITHGPPWGILDQSVGRGSVVNCGSRSLLYAVYQKEPRYHCFGHIHENSGRIHNFQRTTFMNCSHVDEFYKPANKSRKIEIKI